MLLLVLLLVASAAIGRQPTSLYQPGLAAATLGSVGGAWADLDASADQSWLLMVEAGRDEVAVKRITPKSVFIAPALNSRMQKCKDGFRYDAAGRCVRVVRVDAGTQLDQLLKRLQSSPFKKHLQERPNPLGPPNPPSNGPTQFSLSFTPQKEKATNNTSTISRPNVENATNSAIKTTVGTALPVPAAEVLPLPSLPSLAIEGSGDYAITPSTPTPERTTTDASRLPEVHPAMPPLATIPPTQPNQALQEVVTPEKTPPKPSLPPPPINSPTLEEMNPTILPELLDREARSTTTEQTDETTTEVDTETWTVIKERTEESSGSGALIDGASVQDTPVGASEQDTVGGASIQDAQFVKDNDTILGGVKEATEVSDQDDILVKEIHQQVSSFSEQSSTLQESTKLPENGSAEQNGSSTQESTSVQNGTSLQNDSVKSGNLQNSSVQDNQSDQNGSHENTTIQNGGSDFVEPGYSDVEVDSEDGKTVNEDIEEQKQEERILNNGGKDTSFVRFPDDVSERRDVPVRFPDENLPPFGWLQSGWDRPENQATLLKFWAMIPTIGDPRLNSKQSADESPKKTEEESALSDDIKESSDIFEVPEREAVERPLQHVVEETGSLEEDEEKTTPDEVVKQVSSETKDVSPLGGSTSEDLARESGEDVSSPSGISSTKSKELSPENETVRQFLLSGSPPQLPHHSHSKQVDEEPHVSSEPSGHSQLSQYPTISGHGVQGGGTVSQHTEHSQLPVHSPGHELPHQGHSSVNSANVPQQAVTSPQPIGQYHLPDYSSVHTHSHLPQNGATHSQFNKQSQLADQFSVHENPHLPQYGGTHSQPSQPDRSLVHEHFLLSQHGHSSINGVHFPQNGRTSAQFPEHSQAHEHPLLPQNGGHSSQLPDLSSEQSQSSIHKGHLPHNGGHPSQLPDLSSEQSHSSIYRGHLPRDGGHPSQLPDLSSEHSHSSIHRGHLPQNGDQLHHNGRSSGLANQVSFRPGDEPYFATQPSKTLEAPFAEELLLYTSPSRNNPDSRTGSDNGSFKLSGSQRTLQQLVSHRQGRFFGRR